MKKTFLSLFIICLACVVSQTANACDIEGLYENYQAVYLPSVQTWSTDAKADDRIVLEKKVSSGSGSYSEYYYLNGDKAITLSSNYEFIKDGMLIAVNNAELKYSQVTFDGNFFKEIPLCEQTLQKLFPDAQIIKISEFKDNKIIIKKEFFKKKQILFVNDTDKYFYKYSYSPSYVNKKCNIKGLINISRYGNIKFSHYGDKKDMLTIKVR